MKTIKIQQIKKQLNKFTTEELCSIYNNLNYWKWDERLGRKPDNFEHLPDYQKKRYGISKDTYITPIIKEIRRRVSEHDLLRFHHINNLGRTEKEFEEWWDAEHGQYSEYDQSIRCQLLISVVSIVVFTVAVVLDLLR